MNAPVRTSHLAAVSLHDDLPPSDAADDRWRELLGQLGSDIATALTRASERVRILTTTGKIDRQGLRALRDDVESARRMGMIGQQMARYASGQIRQSPEPISLTQLVRDVLVQRNREFSGRSLELRQSLRPAEVVADPTLLHALVQAVMDWSVELAQGSLEFRIDFKPWPARAMLVCRVHLQAAEAPVGVVAASDRGHALDTLSWRLVQQLAQTLAVDIHRDDFADHADLLIEFPTTVQEQIEGVTAVELDQGFVASENSMPLAGSHVLVVASRRDLRSDIREATRPLGLLVDFVSSVEEAEAFCRDSLPHALIVESVLAGDRFKRLQQSIRARVPNFVFIEIAEEGVALELSSEAGRPHALVGRAAVMESLPSALLFELSRTI